MDHTTVSTLNKNKNKEQCSVGNEAKLLETLVLRRINGPIHFVFRYNGNILSVNTSQLVRFFNLKWRLVIS